MILRGALTATAASLLLAGCFTAPGQRMDIVTQPAEPPPRDIRERADIFAIDANTVARLQRDGRTAAQRLPPRPTDFQPADTDYRYLVGPQDELRVTVFEHPELTNPSGTANELSGRVVNSDGRFFFPYLGQVEAGGRTVQEIRDTIANGLRAVIRNPQVDVSVLRYRSQRLVVAGEVRNPGSVPITDVPPNLSDVIAQAGGLTPEADLSAITVARGNQSVRVDLYAFLYDGESQQNLRLRAGDVVNIPDRRFSKVFVLGEVGIPTSRVMPRGRLTLAEALADSGGLNPFTANAGQVYVLRNGMAKTQIYHLDAKSPEALVLADKFDLRPRDVVYVDAVPVVRWARVVNNILPTADFLRESLNDLSPGLPR